MPISMRSAPFSRQGDPGGDGVRNTRIAGRKVADQGCPALGAGAVNGNAADLLVCCAAGWCRRILASVPWSQLFPFFADFCFR
jgi:hypothetical protein